MGAVTLHSNFDNIDKFIPSLFDSSVRDIDKVRAAMENSSLQYDFAGSKNRGLILNSWRAAWKNANGDDCDNDALSRCPAVDRKLIAFLSSYLKRNNAKSRMSLCHPKLSATGDTNDDGISIYKTAGYEAHPFFTDDGHWNYGEIASDGTVSAGKYEHATVSSLLSYLYFGAHFVVVSTAHDNQGSKDVENFYQAVNSSFSVIGGSSDGLSWSVAPNSHYATLLNTSAYYYLDIEKDEEPSTNPLICAFLVGRTSDGGDTNTFFQLEGWQWHAMEGLMPSFGLTGWHHDDYQAHKKTIWNFSTFGASAYSEKRSTPLFICGPHFDYKTLDAATHMPAYVGAGSHQGWMHTDLLRIP